MSICLGSRFVLTSPDFPTLGIFIATLLPSAFFQCVLIFFCLDLSLSFLGGGGTLAILRGTSEMELWASVYCLHSSLCTNSSPWVPLCLGSLPPTPSLLPPLAHSGLCFVLQPLGPCRCEPGFLGRACDLHLWENQGAGWWHNLSAGDPAFSARVGAAGAFLSPPGLLAVFGGECLAARPRVGRWQWR